MKKLDKKKKKQEETRLDFSPKILQGSAAIISNPKIHYILI